MPLVVGLLFEVTRGLAMTLGFVGFAEHVRDFGRLALVARGSLVSRGGPVMRWAPPAALIVLLGSHVTQASAAGPYAFEPGTRTSPHRASRPWPSFD